MSENTEQTAAPEEQDEALTTWPDKIAASGEAASDILLDMTFTEIEHGNHRNIPESIMAWTLLTLTARLSRAEALSANPEAESVPLEYGYPGRKSLAERVRQVMDLCEKRHEAGLRGTLKFAEREMMMRGYTHPINGDPTYGGIIPGVQTNPLALHH